MPFGPRNRVHTVGLGGADLSRLGRGRDRPAHDATNIEGQHTAGLRFASSIRRSPRIASLGPDRREQRHPPHRERRRPATTARRRSRTSTSMAPAAASGSDPPRASERGHDGQQRAHAAAREAADHQQHVLHDDDERERAAADSRPREAAPVPGAARARCAAGPPPGRGCRAPGRARPATGTWRGTCSPRGGYAARRSDDNSTPTPQSARRSSSGRTSAAALAGGTSSRKNRKPSRSGKHAQEVRLGDDQLALQDAVPQRRHQPQANRRPVVSAHDDLVADRPVQDVLDRVRVANGGNRAVRPAPSRAAATGSAARPSSPPATPGTRSAPRARTPAAPPGFAAPAARTGSGSSHRRPGARETARTAPARIPGGPTAPMPSASRPASLFGSCDDREARTGRAAGTRRCRRPAPDRGVAAVLAERLDRDDHERRKRNERHAEQAATRPVGHVSGTQAGQRRPAGLGDLVHWRAAQSRRPSG